MSSSWEKTVCETLIAFRKLSTDEQFGMMLDQVRENEILMQENRRYQQEIDKMQAGIPSEWAYAQLQKENDKLKEKLTRSIEQRDWWIGEYAESCGGDGAEEIIARENEKLADKEEDNARSNSEV